jgi:hypothetical protein
MVVYCSPLHLGDGQSGLSFTKLIEVHMTLFCYRQLLHCNIEFPKLFLNKIYLTFYVL